MVQKDSDSKKIVPKLRRSDQRSRKRRLSSNAIGPSAL